MPADSFLSIEIARHKMKDGEPDDFTESND